MTTKSVVSRLLLVALGVVLTVSAENLWSTSGAATRPEEVKLGHPTSQVLKVIGNPEKISYGPDHQIWYYSNPAGELKARFWLHEGVVVRIGD